MNPVVVGITGASGSIFAKRCVEALRRKSITPILVCTDAGQRVWHDELEETFKDWVGSIDCSRYDIGNIGAPIASGTHPVHGMIIIPCSMGTLASIAHGLSANLLERSADVTIKERRPFVIVPRESPLSVIHLNNMLTLAQLGAKIVPPMPAFYTHIKTLDEYIEQTVGRALHSLGIETALLPTQIYKGD